LNQSRREFIRKAGYAAPAVLTMSSMPAIASTGSVEQEIPETIETAQPARWQTRQRRRYIRRMERQGVQVERFSDWSSTDNDS
jgi:hypothetical protein